MGEQDGLVVEAVRPSQHLVEVDVSHRAASPDRDLLVVEGHPPQGDSPFDSPVEDFIPMQRLYEDAFLQQGIPNPPLPAEPWDSASGILTPQDEDEDFDPQEIRLFEYWPPLTRLS